MKLSIDILHLPAAKIVTLECIWWYAWPAKLHTLANGLLYLAWTNKADASGFEIVFNNLIYYNPYIICNIID